VIAHAKRTEFSQFPGRDTVRPVAGIDCAKALYAKAGITDPLRQIDCAELYVPFSWYEPMWLEGHLLCEENEGWKLTDSGATELGGSFPVNMSGGVLSSNPIGASGMIRCLEAASQVRGTAGDYQVDGARIALGHAYGGAAQYFAMWIVSSEPSPSF
jgi:acetyl-CoA C-acetyltransferase